MLNKQITYHDNGNKCEEGFYKDGKLIFKRCFDVEGNECECSDLGRDCK